MFGDPELLELKRRVFDSVTPGDRPESLIPPQGRFARGVIKVAPRQLHARDGSSPSLPRGRQAYDLADRPSSSHGC